MGDWQPVENTPKNTEWYPAFNLTSGLPCSVQWNPHFNRYDVDLFGYTDRYDPEFGDEVLVMLNLPKGGA